MLCISRYTDDTYAQQFGDGRHKFYLEFRCNRPCLKNLECCAKCAEKSVGTTLQHSRKFNHGNVNEPIPDTSHIFGGKWYNDGIRKWGAPPSEIIEFALQYQKEARSGFIVEQPDCDNELISCKKESMIIEEMPRAMDGTPPVKRTRKPKIAPTETSDMVSEEVPKKRTRKPKVAPSDTAVTEDVIIESSASTLSSSTSKKSSTPKKATSTPYSNIITTNQLIHKEVVIPSYIETTLDKFDTDGFTIEYVKLELFEANGSTYLIDNKKKKLYKRIKDKDIGVYIGRWNPDTDTIITDIPDSDDEE